MLVTPPLLSIVIPAWNREGRIERAIASIVSGGPDGSFELVVVDDGSGDATAQDAERAIAAAGIHNGRVIRQDNAGPGAARNRGAAETTGRFLAFLDSDDFWFPWTLERICALLEAPDAPDLMFLQNIDFPASAVPSPDPFPPDTQTERVPDFLDAALAKNGPRLGSCNVVIRRRVFEKIGGFHADMRCAEDTDLFLRTDQADCLLVRAPVMMAYETGGDNNLTGDYHRVRRGLDALLAREASGIYPGGAGGRLKRHQVLAKSVAYTTLKAFEAGYPLAAYGLYLRHLPQLIRGREWHWFTRLPLLPLLHVLKPGHFLFKMRPNKS